MEVQAIYFFVNKIDILIFFLLIHGLFTAELIKEDF